MFGVLGRVILRMSSALHSSCVYFISFIRTSIAVLAYRSLSEVSGELRHLKSSSVIGDMPMILCTALVISDFVFSVFSYIACFIVVAVVMFIMCSSDVDEPCYRLVNLFCMLSNLLSMLSTLFFTSVMLSVFCVIFCVSLQIDFFISSVFSVLFLVMVLICVLISV